MQDTGTAAKSRVFADADVLEGPGDEGSVDVEQWLLGLADVRGEGLRVAKGVEDEDRGREVKGRTKEKNGTREWMESARKRIVKAPNTRRMEVLTRGYLATHPSATNASPRAVLFLLCARDP